MFVNTKYRSNKIEIMDDLNMEGELLLKTLDQIAAINRRLGGNKATIQGLYALLGQAPKDVPVSIIDLGCGSGDMLRAIADLGRKQGRIFKLIGIDANEYTINYARRLSVEYPEISYKKMDVFSDEFSALSGDIVLATLFLHHFKDPEIEKMLASLLNKISMGIVINDLHRCRRAYWLFRMISPFISNPMVRNDGAISVLRGFKKNELLEINNKLPGSTGSVQWKWAFRYLWIIRK